MVYVYVLLGMTVTTQRISTGIAYQAYKESEWLGEIPQYPKTYLGIRLRGFEHY